MEKTMQVRQFASELLEALPGNLCFHNDLHTHEVVAASQLIGRRSGLSDKEMERVELAAWLHDLGYSVVYRGHEAVSMEMARRVLTELDFDEKTVEAVVGCIGATKWSVSPANRMEAVLRDANFFYLAGSDFVEKSLMLRAEWERVLGRVFSNRTWWELNIRFGHKQKYVTHYGQQVLERRKRRNLKSIALRYTPSGTRTALPDTAGRRQASSLRRA